MLSAQPLPVFGIGLFSHPPALKGFAYLRYLEVGRVGSKTKVKNGGEVDKKSSVCGSCSGKVYYDILVAAIA